MRVMQIDSTQRSAALTGGVVHAARLRTLAS